ncbi:hypothetical protein JW935_17780 [candidate division KSB1 bacterium]|nr:hypothetical protein [candidate division KSB1 bacterium]
MTNKKFFIILIPLFAVIIVSCKRDNLPTRQNNDVIPDDECGECRNPIVRLEPAQIHGTYPDHFNKYVVDVALNYWGSWGWNEWKKEHLCADTYYIFKDDFTQKRYGIKQGEARYIVMSNLTIKIENGNAVVRYVLDDSDVVQHILVQRLGFIELNTELTALKNQQIYDSGHNTFDWIPDPPEGEFWSYAYESVTVDGETYLPADGIFLGDFGPSALGDLVSDFVYGDVGRTIRKKETPSACTIEFDDHKGFFDYYSIWIKNIKNLFDEPLPDNVRIAVKTEYGEIKGEEIIDGWSILTSSGGEIPDAVQYKIPECPRLKLSQIEIAAVCEWHDGEPQIGKTRITSEIPIIDCAVWEGDLVFSESGSGSYHYSDDSESTNATCSWENSTTIHLALAASEFCPYCFGQMGFDGTYSIKDTRNSTTRYYSQNKVCESSHNADCGGILSPPGDLSSMMASLTCYEDKGTYKLHINFAFGLDCNGTYRHKCTDEETTTSEYEVSICRFDTAVFPADPSLNGFTGQYNGDMISGQYTYFDKDSGCMGGGSHYNVSWTLKRNHQ